MRNRITLPRELGRDIESAGIRVIDSFDSRAYYSGADVRFEFDGIPVPDIAGVSYKLLEPTRFHYGYASYTRTHTSRGQRLVQGNILVNFKDPTILLEILKRIKYGETPDDDFEAGDKNAAPNVRQDVLNALAAGKISTNTIKNLLNMKSGDLSRSLSISKGKINREVIEAFRDHVWGADNPSTADAKLHTQPNSPKMGTGPNGFNLRMIFGEPGYKQQGDDQIGRRLGAVVRISGVEIMSEGVEIHETGEPIRFSYEYLAADVN